MKTIIALLALFALALVASAQPSVGPEYASTTSTNLAYSTTLTTPTLTGFILSVGYQYDFQNGTSPLVSIPSQPAQLVVDVIAKVNSTLMVNGVTYTYGQAMAIWSAIVAQERAAQLAAVSAKK